MELHPEGGVEVCFKTGILNYAAPEDGRVHLRVATGRTYESMADAASVEVPRSVHLLIPPIKAG